MQLFTSIAAQSGRRVESLSPVPFFSCRLHSKFKAIKTYYRSSAAFISTFPLERHPFLAKAHFREIGITQALAAFAFE